MKKIIIFCLVLMVLALPVSAAENLVVDHAGLLTSSQAEELEAQLSELRSAYDMEVVILTTDSLGGKTPQDYADDFYDQYYGNDGVLLLVSTEDNDWYISTCGYGITAFTDAGIDYIGEQITDYLSDKEYVKAFEEFTRQCDDFLRQAKTGDPYDSHNLPKGDFSLVTNLIFALVIGLIVAWISTRVMKGKLKTVHKQTMADDYVTAGSMKVDRSKDLFLYSRLDRTARPRESSSSSTHTSLSGRTHGGGGGKF